MAQQVRKVQRGRKASGVQQVLKVQLDLKVNEDQQGQPEKVVVARARARLRGTRQGSCRLIILVDKPESGHVSNHKEETCTRTTSKHRWSQHSPSPDSRSPHSRSLSRSPHSPDSLMVSRRKTSARRRNENLQDYLAADAR